MAKSKIVENEKKRAIERLVRKAQSIKLARTKKVEVKETKSDVKPVTDESQIVLPKQYKNAKAVLQSAAVTEKEVKVGEGENRTKMGVESNMDCDEPVGANREPPRLPVPPNPEDARAVEEFAETMNRRVRRAEESLRASEERQVSLREQLGQQQRRIESMRRSEVTERQCRERLRSLNLSEEDPAATTTRERTRSPLRTVAGSCRQIIRDPQPPPRHATYIDPEGNFLAPINDDGSFQHRRNNRGNRGGGGKGKGKGKNSWWWY